MNLTYSLVKELVNAIRPNKFGFVLSTVPPNAGECVAFSITRQTDPSSADVNPVTAVPCVSLADLFSITDALAGDLTVLKEFASATAVR